MRVRLYLFTVNIFTRWSVGKLRQLQTEIINRAEERIHGIMNVYHNTIHDSLVMLEMKFFFLIYIKCILFVF